MSAGTGPGATPVDDVLDRLEAAIARLADGRAPLQELVRSHDEAVRLMEEAEGRLAELARALERLGTGREGAGGVPAPGAREAGREDAPPPR
ncbi:MAG: exodeoxyribonuclease VII small subunit [Candidatus Dormibacterales bacterium]